MSLKTSPQTSLAPAPSFRPPKSRAKRGRRRQQSMAYLFVAPATLLFMLFIVYGIAYNVSNSLQSQTFYGTSVFVGLHHFASMVQDPVFWSALRNNGLWFVVTVGIQTLLGIILALLLDLRILGSRFVKTVMFAPVILSPVVIGLIWESVYDPYQGLLATFWHGSPDWLGSPQLALISTSIVNIWQWTGFSMLLYLAAVQDIPRELREAAAIDGAGYWKTARYVLLPLLAPATTTLLLLGLIGSLQTFTLVFVMTKGGPGNASQVLGTYIYQKTFVEGNFGYGSALSVVLLAITLILTIVLPNTVSSLTVVVIWTFINAWNEFLLALLFMTSDSMKTIALAPLAFEGVYQSSAGALMAILVVISIPSLLLYLALQRQLEKGVQSGALKG